MVRGEKSQLSQYEEREDLHTLILPLPQVKKTSRQTATQFGHTGVVWDQRLDVPGGGRCACENIDGNYGVSKIQGRRIAHKQQYYNRHPEMVFGERTGGLT